MIMLLRLVSAAALALPLLIAGPSLAQELAAKEPSVGQTAARERQK